MTQKLTALPTTPHDHDYNAFEDLIASRVASADGPLFQTDAAGLWEAYIGGLPESHRQHYNCRNCRRFIEQYGGLVTIVGENGLAEVGTKKSLLWFNLNGLDREPAYFCQSIDALRAKVRNARVVGVFLSFYETWGRPHTDVTDKQTSAVVGRWTHLHGRNPHVYRDLLRTADQRMAELRQDHGMLSHALSEIPLEAAVQAVRVLEADVLDRSEKTLGNAKWFLSLHQRIAGQRDPIRRNLVWLAVAKAPPGWCHIRSTMISKLLDDVIAGMPFEAIKIRWAAKMHPLAYQRPQTVKDGNLEQANKIVEKLGAEGSLARRFATLKDVLTPLWLLPTKEDLVEPPKDQPSKPKGGAFDHLLGKRMAEVNPVELPPKRITWERFAAEVLPGAERIEAYCPHRGNYYGLVTAVNNDAPAILQWDGLDGLPRNPTSWYVYHGGSLASQWNLIGNAWADVTAMFPKPPAWQRPDKFAHHGAGVFFSLRNAHSGEPARDMDYKSGGGLFPEQLRSEFHSIRQAIEAHARSAEIVGRDVGDANGLMLGGNALIRLRVNGDVYDVTIKE